MGLLKKGLSSNDVINYILAALSGVLLALAFPYPSITILAWVGLQPLLYAIKRSSLKQAPFLGLVFGITFFSIVLYWIQIFGIIAWIALSLMLSAWTLLFAVGSKLVLDNFSQGRAGVFAQFILIPSIWALTEYGRTLGPWGFAWANLGSTAADFKISILASFIGEVGLSAVIVLVNLAVLRVFELAIEGTKQRVTAGGMKANYKALGLTTGAVALVLAVLSAGQAAPLKQNGGSSFRLAIIQPNIPQSVKLDTGNNDDIKARYLAMTKEALKGAPWINLIIWPESVFISDINDEKAYIDQVAGLTARNNAALIYGGLYRDGVKGKVYNSAYFIDNKGQRFPRYDKMHLVPFGEYMPFRSLVERVNDMATLVDDKTPGTQYRVYDFARTQITKGFPDTDLSLGRFATIICFESADSRLVGKMVRRGAQMLVVITNDGWFGNTAALEQHFLITRMRAIEYGIPVIQAANTGVSGIVDRTGGVVTRTEINKQKVIIGSAEFSAAPSFFSKYGYLMPYLYLGAILLAALYKRLIRTN